MQPIIGKVTKDSLGAKYGFKVDDKIISIAGKEVNYWHDFHNTLQNTKDKETNVVVNRAGKEVSLAINVPKDSRLNVQAKDTYSVTDEYSFGAAFTGGFSKTITTLVYHIKQFKVVFNTDTKAYTQVKGPLGIIEQMPTKWNWGFFWNFTALFSVWLAFLNILPIPALDGGHVMFLLYEMITGKAPSQKVLERGQMIGFVILMSLMALIFGNDIWNLIKGFFN